MICHAVFHLIVRELIEGSYELIAGERRLIAAIASNHTTIPAKILNLSDRDARSLAMAENLQREDLNGVYPILEKSNKSEERSHHKSK